MPTLLPQDQAALEKKIIQQLKAAKIEHRIFETLEQTFDAALAQGGMVLSANERRHLLTQAARTILEDMLKKLAARKSAKK